MGLDALELIMGWEDAFSIKLNDDEALALETPKMAIELISAKVDASDSQIGVCPVMRAYCRTRDAFQSVLGLQRQQFQLDSKLHNLLPKAQRQEHWNQLCSYICSNLGISELPSLNLGFGLLCAPITVRDLVDWLVARYPNHFLDLQAGWTHFQVRSVVRAVIRDVAGVKAFKDDDKFWEIGI